MSNAKSAEYVINALGESCWVNRYGHHYPVTHQQKFRVTLRDLRWWGFWPCRNHNPPRVLRRFRR